ncbi:hypothetical protein CRG98_033855 [Punica granatum]|uniref:Uncharacterized protein n=1 Tax=Punica granatum TaxID=22663 RepID=A0A2I0INY1_PUNGR|nr:hypothetical protein CRG98_033855 [Punica granatum]
MTSEGVDYPNQGVLASNRWKTSRWALHQSPEAEAQARFSSSTRPKCVKSTLSTSQPSRESTIDALISAITQFNKGNQDRGLGRQRPLWAPTTSVEVSGSKPPIDDHDHSTEVANDFCGVVVVAN